jgi:hypothetical protein
MNPQKEGEPNDILERIARLERAVFGPDSRRMSTKKRKAGELGGLPDHILSLRDSGFCDSPKTTSEFHQKLQPKYACEPNRVAMALLRLQRQRQLRKVFKEVDGRTVVAYAR